MHTVLLPRLYPIVATSNTTGVRVSTGVLQEWKASKALEWVTFNQMEFVGQWRCWSDNGGSGAWCHMTEPLNGLVKGGEPEAWCVCLERLHDKPVGVWIGNDVRPAKCRSESIYLVSSSCDTLQNCRSVLEDHVCGPWLKGNKCEAMLVGPMCYHIMLKKSCQLSYTMMSELWCHFRYSRRSTHNLL
jgi:hypothetical protein